MGHLAFAAAKKVSYANKIPIKWLQCQAASLSLSSLSRRGNNIITLLHLSSLSLLGAKYSLLAARSNFIGAISFSAPRKKRSPLLLQ